MSSQNRIQNEEVSVGTILCAGFQVSPEAVRPDP